LVVALEMVVLDELRDREPEVALTERAHMLDGCSHRVPVAARAPDPPFRPALRPGEPGLVSNKPPPDRRLSIQVDPRMTSTDPPINDDYIGRLREQTPAAPGRHLRRQAGREDGSSGRGPWNTACFSRRPEVPAHVIPSGTYHFERVATTSKDEATPLP
jgi:hypothetical protein